MREAALRAVRRGMPPTIRAISNDMKGIVPNQKTALQLRTRQLSNKYARQAAAKEFGVTLLSETEVKEFAKQNPAFRRRVRELAQSPDIALKVIQKAGESNKWMRRGAKAMVGVDKQIQKVRQALRSPAIRNLMTGIKGGAGRLMKGATGAFKANSRTKPARFLTKVVKKTPIGHLLSLLSIGSTVSQARPEDQAKVLQNEVMGEGGSMVGALAGAKGGALAGAAIGSIFPGAGTAIGAVVGGVIGAVAGGWAGDKMGRKASAALWPKTEKFVTPLWQSGKSAASKAGAKIGAKATSAWEASRRWMNHVFSPSALPPIQVDSPPMPQFGPRQGALA
jgi:uncharacterized protein YcfJ